MNIQPMLDQHPSFRGSEPIHPRPVFSPLYFHGVQCKIHLVDGVLSPLVCRGREGGGWLDEEAKREARERERERMGGYRKPSVRPMPRRLYRFTTERRTSVNRYLLTVDFPWPLRNQPNSPLLPFVSPFVPSFSPSLFSSLFFLLHRFALPRLSQATALLPSPSRRRGEASPDTLEVV